MIGSFKDMDRKRRERGFTPPKILEHAVLQAWYTRVAGSIMTGVLLAVAFPGSGRSVVIYAAFVPLLFAVQSVSVRRAAGLGLLSGFVFFMLSLSWLQNLTGMVEGIGLKASALLGYGVLAIYCALYFIPFSVAATLGPRRWAGGSLRHNIRFMAALSPTSGSPPASFVGGGRARAWRARSTIPWAWPSA